MTTPSGSVPETAAGPPAGPAAADRGDRAPEAGQGLPVAPAAPPAEEAPLLEAERIPRREGEVGLGPGRAGAAWMLALAADALQWVLFPLFVGGAASSFDVVVDVVVAGVLVRLLGWHWAFLPSFVAELIPGVDLVPTWTLAVFIASRGRRKA